MAQLNQILAAQKGQMGREGKLLTATYHAYQSADALQGLSRVYKPRDDDGDQLPEESTLVKVKCRELIETARETLTAIMDLEATKDWANTEAKADIVVGEGDDAVTLAEDVPVTLLLALEKDLENLHTFVTRLPALDPAEEWDYDPAVGAYRSKPSQTTRTKKVPRNHVLAEATKEHPAQVQVYNEDIIVGTWTATKFSGALPRDEIRAMARRVEAVQKAVKYAREKANTIEVENRQIGGKLLDFVFDSN